MENKTFLFVKCCFFEFIVVSVYSLSLISYCMIKLFGCNCSVNAYVVFKSEESAQASLAHNMAVVSFSYS